ncbi:hypothetical protein EJ02DRAFT_121924 [Clathrospora elynae]|uniref:Uncharacterized protein n=1 Tax=Clathrospora elynae TaxID=706981 RepID=A0A6A5T401_9PLEO|nr:hypothetical protein EJ02DRAFT_121924 [Clathrospora elynae]
MRSFSTLAFMALPLFSAVFAEPASPIKQVDRIYSSAQEAFQDLLNALPEESLQAALSGLKDFKDGVFESHHRGVEHVHDSNPALATRLIVAAVQDLKKRQANPGNGTTAANPPTLQTSAQVPSPGQSSNTPTVQSSPAPEQPQQSSEGTAANTPAPAPSTTAQRPALIPVEATVTTGGRTVVQTSQILSEVTASVAVTIVQTNSQGRTTVSTSAAMYAPTAGEVATTTNAEGATFLTTYTPGGGKVSSLKLITTTDAGGRPTTLTSYTYVDPIQATQTAGDAPTQTVGKPGLQTGAATKNAAQFAMFGLGALAMFV